MNLVRLIIGAVAACKGTRRDAKYKVIQQIHGFIALFSNQEHSQL